MTKWKPAWKKFWKDESGIGTLEIILIVAVLILIAFLFRGWIISWVNKLLGNANDRLNDSPTSPCTPSADQKC